MMDISCLSEYCAVRRLDEGDIPALLRLCSGNPLYYRHCPPNPTEDKLRSDMAALPPGKTHEDKYYLGYFMGGDLVAVIDLILGFPNDQTAFVGFFMVDALRQGSGLGSRLVDELCAALSRDYRFIRLGYVSGNRQSEHFWLKNGFEPTGVVSRSEGYDIVMLSRGI